jgi:peptidoglycan-N-acetylglucosamine deacetylase
LSLSFDDARPSQVSRGLDLLERLDVQATFFALPGIVRRDIRGWRAIVERGHEIGNHSLRHPCAGNLRSSRKGALEQLTLADIEADLVEASRQLEDLLGVTPRVFAYPCGQTFVGRGTGTQSYVPVVARKFLVGRTFNDLWANSPLRCDLAQVAAINSDAKPIDALRRYLDAALIEGSWVVLGGHEIGASGHDSTVPATVEAVVGWCRTEGVRIGTVGAVGDMVARMQQSAVTDARTASNDPARASLSARHQLPRDA